MAWIILQDAFAMVKDILVQRHPQLLRYLFMQFWDQTFDAHPKFRRQLFESVASLAEVYLGARHPITVISRLLPKVHDRSQIYELA